MTLPRLTGNNNYFSKIIADVFPLWYCVNTDPDAPVQKTDNISVFIEVFTLADDYLIKCISSVTFGCYFVLVEFRFSFC